MTSSAYCLSFCADCMAARWPLTTTVGVAGSPASAVCACAAPPQTSAACATANDSAVILIGFLTIFVSIFVIIYIFLLNALDAVRSHWKVTGPVSVSWVE
jgi:hypothetical protein